MVKIIHLSHEHNLRKKHSVEIEINTLVFCIIMVLMIDFSAFFHQGCSTSISRYMGSAAEGQDSRAQSCKDYFRQTQIISGHYPSKHSDMWAE